MNRWLSVALSVSKGSKPQAKPLIVSAHLDTVFPFEMDLSVKREADQVYGIGIGDNSVGVAALIGLIWMLREQRFDYAGAPLSANRERG